MAPRPADRRHSSEGPTGTLDLEFAHSLEKRLSSAWNQRVAVAELAPFGDGHSGMTYRVELERDQESLTAILRTSGGERPIGPADVARQARIMQALHRKGVPVPEIYAYEEAPIRGQSFYIAEFIEGRGWEDELTATGDHAGLAAATVAAMAALQSVDASEVGLDLTDALDPAGELERWRRLLKFLPDCSKSRAERLADQLQMDMFPLTDVSVVHGDFHYGNLIFQDGQVAAIIDWEIASLGSPYLDLGCLAVASLRRRYGEPNPTGDVDIPLAALVDLAGMESEEAGWFIALSCLKYSTIIGYNLERHRSGRRPDAIYESLTGTMDRLVDDGLELLAGGIDGM